MGEPTDVPAGADRRPDVDDLLGRYDATLTRLAADPIGSTDPAGPVLITWFGVVEPTSALAADMPAEALERLRSDNSVVRPPVDGPSYVHRVLEVVPAVDGAVAFTWCGWSPGIATDVTTGAVTDDAVAHSHGTGRAEPRSPTGSLVLVSLTMTDRRILPPGSADPCPAEIASVPR